MRSFKVIGELINNSFARARRAWGAKDLAAYQKLACLQDSLGANYLTVNTDGTQTMRVRQEEMIAFLADLVPALQAVTALPLAFDNPSILFHRRALELYDRSKSAAPILNSLAASRESLPEMIDLVREYDTLVVVMASEKFTPTGTAQCVCAKDVYEASRHFVELLVDKGGRKNDQIIIDPGLAPVGADTYGLVNMALDAMRLIRQDPDLAGVHISVGLTNFSFGTPPELRPLLQQAFLTLAVEAGLDFVLANPEHELRLMESSDATLRGVQVALQAGRPEIDETQETAGYRQAEKIMELF